MYFSYLVICFYSKAYFSNALGCYSTLPDLALAACTCINIVGMMIMVMVLVVMVMVMVVGMITSNGAGVYGGDDGVEEQDIHRRLVCLFSRLLAVPDLRHLEQTQ